MRKWYGRTIEKVVQSLDSDISLGLNEDKIIQMRETYGGNIILKPESQKLLTLIVNEIKQFWILEVLILIGILYYNGFSILAYVIIFITIICVGILTHGDYNKEKDLMAIDNLNTSNASVIRGGRVLEINCQELVVGDIVILEKYSSVAADIRILECTDFKVREVAVTGEKYEVEKYPMKIEEEVLNLSEIRNMVFKSSVVTGGSALGIVIATGMNTQIGEIIKVLLEHKAGNRVFGKAIANILNKAAIFLVVVNIVTLLFLVLKKIDIYEIGNALIYIFMPLNVPLFIIIISLFFRSIFSKFKRENIYIKNISTIFVLSNISAIFVKKIGAISESKLVFREIYCDGTIFNIQNESIKLEDTMERAISIALLCNDTKLYKDGQLCVENNSIENLSECAILEFCNERFSKVCEVQSKHKRIFKISYDSYKRIKTVVNEVDGRYRANVTGILDSLLNKCTHILINGIEKELKESDIQDIINMHITMSNKDYNVIGLGYRNFNYEPSIHENIESNLVFVGLMGFENPIKESTHEAMEICKNNNIRVIVDEVDNKLASFAFGKSMGIIKNKEEVLSGIEMEHMTKEEFQKNMDKISIYSKISPRHKSEIVNALNTKGYFVASVGDTLTDLEYLNSSHISISVGADCSNIVKKLSSLFLKENDFGGIIKLIQDSKRIVNFIEKLGLFVGTMALSEIFITLLSLIVKGELPYRLSSMLYLNFLVIPICGLSIVLQNRNTQQITKKNDYKYTITMCIKKSLMITTVYLLILGLASMVEIINPGRVIYIILALYGNIFSLTLLYEKHYLKNMTSYNLIIFNILTQILWVIYLTM